MKTANIINMIVTGLLLATIIWLVSAEIKRMKLNKEIAEASTTTTPATT